MFRRKPKQEPWKSTLRIEDDVRPLDLVLLELPASVQCPTGAVPGTDYAVGFFEGLHTIQQRRFITINQIQKVAYAQPTPSRYPIEDVPRYQLLKKYTPDESDPIDRILADFLNVK